MAKHLVVLSITILHVQLSVQQCTTHGDMMALDPDGASFETAHAGGLPLEVVAVEASNQLVAEDEAVLREVKDCFDNVGVEFGIYPALIAAIASKESRGGRFLNQAGYIPGLSNNRYGIMQCDEDRSGLDDCTIHGIRDCNHIRSVVSHKLSASINGLASSNSHRYHDWTTAMKLQGAVAAYHFDRGILNIVTWYNMDVDSSTKDYSSDVMARAQYLVRNYGWECPGAPPRTEPPASTTPAPPAYVTECSDINFVTRDEWGAQNARYDNDINHPVCGVFIHHTYIPPACYLKVQCIQRVQSIQITHMRTNGWSDIGYHFLIGGDGRVYTGKGWDYIGIHAPNLNTWTYGINFIGDFRTTLPNALQLNTYNKLIRCGVTQGLYWNKLRIIWSQR